MKKAILLAVLLAGACQRPVSRVVVSKTTLLANGYDRATIEIGGSPQKPDIQVLGDSRFTHLQKVERQNGVWRSQLTAGVMPGDVRLRVSSQGHHQDVAFHLSPEISDWAADGTPDFLRLEDESDREAFRRWMTYLAELQYFIEPAKRPSDIRDCSSLVRYAYREATRNHDASWVADAGLPIVMAGSSIRKYAFPHTLLGARIFRTRGGAYSPDDVGNDTFREFADAKNLLRNNMFPVSRDVRRAQPSDILFYQRGTDKGVVYHSMIYLGASQVKPDAEIYVIYHTGPDGTNEGEIRRLTLTQLLHFPNTQWQAIAANPLFLGVYRWNILKAPS